MNDTRNLLIRALDVLHGNCRCNRCHPCILADEIVDHLKFKETPIITVYFDGNGQSTSKKPGRSEVLVEAPNGAPFDTESKFITFQGKTNNELEYGGLILALNGMINLATLHPAYMERAQVIIHGDSKLVIEQTHGRWRVKKDHLFGLRNKARDKFAKLQKLVKTLELSWVPSAENKVDSHP